MRRRSALIIVILLLSFSLPFTTDDSHSGYFNGKAQGSTIQETTPSNDDHTDQTFIVAAILGFLFILHLYQNVTAGAGPAFRKRFFLNPVFYQSNYVIHNL